MILGIDVGGTKIAAGIVDPEGRITDPLTVPTDQSSGESTVRQLVEILAHYSYRKPAAVGIGIPGIADRSSGTVWAPNIKGWEDLDLRARLCNAKGIPLTIEGDRYTALLGECLYGAAGSATDVVFLILGTGIGAGILSGGQVVRGKHEIAGAVGWIPVLFRGVQLHFEEVAAGPAIGRRALMAALPEDLPELAAQARQGNPAAVTLFEEVGAVIGQALSFLVSTLNPELIVIGGGVGRTLDLWKSAAESSMLRWSQPVSAGRVRVVPTALGADAGVLGAAAAARMEMENRHEHRRLL